MHNNADSGLLNQSEFVSTATKRKNEAEHDPSENKNQKLKSDSDAVSVGSFDYDDLIVYSPESYNGELAGEESDDKLLDKEIFLQHENCYRTSQEIPQCRECLACKECTKYNCRFYMFRKIERDNGKFSVAGYMDQLFDPCLADYDIWSKRDTSILKEVNEAARQYILRCVASQFCEMAREEENVFKSHSEHKPNGVVAWKRAVYKVRELCDTCSTSIFNFHYVCATCGTIVCIDCYRERQEGIVVWKLKKSEKNERDKFYWLKCTNDKEHSLILSKMIPGNALSALNEQLHSVCDELKIGLLCSCRDKTIQAAEPSTKLQLQRAITKARRKKQRVSIIRHRSLSNFDQNLLVVKHSYVSKGAVLKFESSSETPESYSLFQCEWERGKPVVVADVKKKLKSNIWTPEYFLNNFGSVRHSLVNCQTDTMIKRVPLKEFWAGFRSYENRLPSNSHTKLILKLKDWPDSQDFAELLEEHYNDIMQNIPFSSYSRRDGIFNLARYQHQHLLKPDLGPKLYCAYGNFDKTVSEIKGSTNLHLDCSDAVNILVHVSRPDDYQLAKGQYNKEEIKKALKLAGCDEEDLRIFMTSEKLPGAIWHIFHSTDVTKIRKALHEYAKENDILLKPYEDPIHNQDWYVDAKLKEALEKKGIIAYTIIQYEGDCIFVPASAPHQVTNIFDCIKLALDYVSPEHISECFTLTNEFRLLSTRHANREDKLQVKSILHQTIKNLVT